MPEPPSSKGSPTARAPVSGLSCPGCGHGLAGRQRASSNVCRAWLSRQRRAEGQRRRDEELEAGLDGIERLARILRLRLERR